MAAPKNHIRIVAPPSFRRTLSRRSFLSMGGAAGGLGLILAACGDDDEVTSTTTGQTGAGTQPGTTAGPGTTEAPGTAGTTAPAGEYSEVINKASGDLSMYTWGEYNDPKIVGALAESTLGVTMTVDYYDSNEDLISKLRAAAGAGGYDIVVPTGPYIPQMVDLDLLEKFDRAQLPNIVNVDPNYLAQAWDPGNEYSVCKDWGSTGWIYDTRVVTTEIATWNDFIAAAQGPASGNMSLLDTPANVAAMYFWANGIDWNTEDAAELDACESFLVDEFASHIKAFDSYPSTKIGEGAYALSMAWNGDARAAFVAVADAGDDPEAWKWGLGAPDTELWMDNYCIAKGAPNPEGAHAWINWILTPEASIQDLVYHGYNSGLKDMPGLIEKHAPDLERADMIFFADAQVQTMHTQELNTSQGRLTQILNAVKAKAGG